MDADKKIERADSLANKWRGPSMTSRALDYEINTSIRDFPEKAENSGLNKSMRDIKQTPDTSMQKSDGYRINFFDLIQNNLFPCKRFLLLALNNISKSIKWKSL